MKSPLSENIIEPIIKLSETHQTILMQTIKNLFKEFEPINSQNPNEIDSFLRKEKKLLEKLDELEGENLHLQGKISEFHQIQLNFDKKMSEIKEDMQAKQNEITSLMKEKERLQAQV